MEKHISLRSCFIVLFGIMLAVVSACAPKPKAPKPSVPQVQMEGPAAEQKTGQPETKQPDIIEILYSEAKKFESQKNYQDALFVYNQALSQVDEKRKPELMDRIESLLSKMPAKDIKPFLEIKNFLVPRPLLLYWFGLNAALSDDRLAAKNAFETFLFEYADHPYAEDVADLLATIKASLFQKNTIGCLLPLSGKYAAFGRRALTGIQMAINDLSEKYHQSFHLIIKDTKADPDTAVDCVRQLHEKNVAAILGPWLTVTEAGQEAEKLQIPMIGLTQKSEFPLEGEYLFSNFISPEMQVNTLGAYLFGQLGIKKVAILYPKEKYGEKYMNLFWDVVDKFNGEVVGAESYDGSKTDFTTAIQKLTGAFYPVPEEIEREELIKQKSKEFGMAPDDPELLKLIASLEQQEQEQAAEQKANIRRKEEQEKIQIDFEALFIPDSPSKINLILPQLAYNDATGMYLVGTNLWHSDSLLKNARGYNKKAIITDGFLSTSQNPVTAAFSAEYKELFQTEPKFLEAIAYDNAVILFSTAQDPGVDSRSALKDALKENRIFEGATGYTMFDKDGGANRQLFLITIKRGKFVEISR